MKKALILSLFFCLISGLFWKPLLQTLYHCRFSFRSISLKEGNLILHDLSYQKGDLTLFTEKLQVDYRNKAFHFSHPLITYKGSFPSELLQEREPKSWAFLIEEGLLNWGAIQVRLTLLKEEGEALLTATENSRLALQYKDREWRCEARGIGKEIWNLFPLPWTLLEGTLNFDALGEKDLSLWTLSWLDGENLKWENGDSSIFCGHLRAHLQSEGSGSFSFSEGTFSIEDPIPLTGRECSCECTLNQGHFLFSTCSGKVENFPIQFDLHGTFNSWVATGSATGPFPCFWEVAGEAGNPLFAQAHMQFGPRGVLFFHWDQKKGVLQGNGENLFGYSLFLHGNRDSSREESDLAGQFNFDLRIENPTYDAARLTGSFDHKALLLDPTRSHLLGEPLSLSASFDSGTLDFSSSLAQGCLSSKKELSLQVGKHELKGQLLCLEGDLALDLSHLFLAFDTANIEGAGRIQLAPHRLAAELDLEVHGPLFSTHTPVHVLYSSDRGLSASNASLAFPYFDCEIERIEKQGDTWRFNDASAKIGGVLLKGDLEMTRDLITGALSPLEDLQIRISNETCKARCLFYDIEVELDACFTSKWEGILRLSEGENPLVINWESTLRDPFLIRSIEGSCFGLTSSFYEEKPGVLIGSAKIDFEKVKEFVPQDFTDLILALKMGRGYEIKGHLFPRGEPRFFKGILTGKDLQLFGYQLKSIFSHLEIKKDQIHLIETKVSDSAGKLEIPEINAYSSKGDPWRLSIPSLLITELRPSLLARPGQPRAPLTPLLVRDLTLRNFQGDLSDSNTYTAEGDLHFINTFKRDRSLFDIPSALLSRLFAFDLEILIPVQGTLTYQLRNGNFELLELKDSFSEGSRSEFFLAPGTVPLMDLDGNLNILVKMKQYVLFTFTENFLISIGGTLEDPKFHLEKKRKEPAIIGPPQEN